MIVSSTLLILITALRSREQENKQHSFFFGHHTSLEFDCDENGAKHKENIFIPKKPIVRKRLFFQTFQNKLIEFMK